MAQNVTLQSPSSMFGAQYTTRDGTTYTIGSTGLVTIPASFAEDAVKAGFSLPSSVTGVANSTIAVASGVIPAANFAGSPVTTLIQSGATALTTPTAAAILAAIPNGQIGTTYRLRIVNTNAGTLTITADASVTATGTLTIATNTWREFDVTITSATTATMKSVGTGTYS